jgi:hypothetical protein
MDGSEPFCDAGYRRERGVGWGWGLVWLAVRRRLRLGLHGAL